MELPPFPKVLTLGKTLGPIAGLMATLLLGGSLLGPGQAAPAAQAEPAIRATVLSIGDGDTIRLACNPCAEAFSYNGNLLMTKAYTALLDLKPGDQFEIKLGKKQIRLLPVGGADKEE